MIDMGLAVYGAAQTIRRCSPRSVQPTPKPSAPLPVSYFMMFSETTSSLRGVTVP
jgi:hypothetical protein